MDQKNAVWDGLVKDIAPEVLFFNVLLNYFPFWGIRSKDRYCNLILLKMYICKLKTDRMRYWCSFIFFLMLLEVQGFAQPDTLRLNPGVTSQTAKMEEFLQTLQIRQDPRITDLLTRHVQINHKRKGADGFRLEIFFSSDSRAREQAMRVRNEFNLIFPDVPSYLLFQTPNFKVRVGDFRNKSEALKTKAWIASKYPNAFIVKDIIRFPKLYTESVEQTEEQ